jgi:Flp pilus assembly pilin Flp
MNAISEKFLNAYLALLGRMQRPEKGASMTEYAILVAVMAGVAFTVVTLLGDKISDFINDIDISTS